ncbi:MAG TPA: YdcF family protein, partial [Planctomycetota bacterium]|nr:YdcF family protein [Planctomycetota bacterium]
LLLIGALLLVAFALRPPTSPWRRLLSRTVILVLLGFTFWNVVAYYILVARGSVSAGLPVPLSLLVSAALLVVLIALGDKAPLAMTRREALAGAAFLGACLVGFPLAQMYCFGKTDYRRPADAVVVLGARTYADGRPSDALADRVRTGVQVFLDGLAGTLVFSGGPGDGQVHETEAMRRMALDLGVPEKAIVLDPGGLNTRETVTNTARLFPGLGCRRILVVSHFYHLPRIKMSYQREGIEVFTVPAKESYFLTWMPFYLLREVAALWVYYLRPLAPRGG